MIEHLKETNTSLHNSHSFGMNFGTMMNFANIPSVTSGMMATPVVRNEKGYSIEETLSKSGIYARDKNIKIGNVIEITPTLRNEEKISVFDTSIINSIGGIASGVQEIKENLEALHEPHHHDIIIDAEPVDVVQGQKEEKKTVIATDAEPRTPDSQAVKEPDYAIHKQEARQLLDEIYYEDIAPYHEFDRAGSPDRVETELTKAVGKVQDVANGLANASDFSNMPDPIIGADSDPQSMVALGKCVMKVAEFAGEIFGTVIEPAANAIGTKVRRVLRDDLSVSQAKAQDIGDITHVVAGILIPGGTAKIWKITRSAKAGKVVKRSSIADKDIKGFMGRRGEKQTGQDWAINKNGIEFVQPKFQKHRNTAQVINGRIYTGHALDQITNRGIPVSLVEHAIKTGKCTVSKITNSCFEFKDTVNNIKVVVDRISGNVITVMFGE